MSAETASEPLRDPSDEATTDEAAGADEGTRADGGFGPPTAMESLVAALLEAGPEVAEHVVKAAQELVLAVQALVDAADRAVQEQQEVRRARAGEAAESASDAPSSSAPSADSVRHLDVAE